MTSKENISAAITHEPGVAVGNPIVSQNIGDILTEARAKELLAGIQPYERCSMCGAINPPLEQRRKVYGYESHEPCPSTPSGGFCLITSERRLLTWEECAAMLRSLLGLLHRLREDTQK